MKQPLFRKKCTDALLSPNALNSYIHVTTPSAWVVFAAIAVFWLGACVWCFTAKLPTNIEVTGIWQEKKLVCYLPPEEAKKISVGMPVRLQGEVGGTVAGLDAVPFSLDEASATLSNDYYVEALGLSAWNVRITVATKESAPAEQESPLCELVIVANEVRPIDFLLSGEVNA